MTSELTTLTAITPIDGRYRRLTERLADHWSEYALIKTRVEVEIEFLIEFLKVTGIYEITESIEQNLREIYQKFSIEDARQVKEIEKTTNHDVKAVEYFIRHRLQNLGLENIIPYVHYGLTSQDINNTAVPIMYRRTLKDVLLPDLIFLTQKLSELAQQWQDVPMLSFTHGQPASPTTIGKELAVFGYRLIKLIKQIVNLPITAKFGGSTGTMATFHLTFPEIDWREFARRFVKKWNLEYEEITTQISNYDNLSQHLMILKGISTILIDLAQDMWLYIGKNYLKLRVIEGEVGSSVMPHKVNPIHFENAEGNLVLGRQMFNALADSLPVSRLQRDLTDSTQLRYVGTAIAFLVIGISNIGKGLDRIEPNKEVMIQELENHYEVLAEALQTTLRREGNPEAYEILKKHTRGFSLSQEAYQQLVSELPFSTQTKEHLLNLKPQDYLGDTPQLVNTLNKQLKELLSEMERYNGSV
ncbi:MAG: adenylosuccinate lyase [Chlorobi bacterium]|nr:adenylosuccinate lyase [Chlorobiota bacterium]